MNQTQKKRFWILGIDAAMVLFGFAARPLAVTMIRWLPDCIFSPFRITCPACGATRCVREFFGGHWKEAFRLHSFLFCLIFYLAVAMLFLNVGYLIPQRHCQKIGETMLGGKAIIVLAIGFSLFGIVRMLLTLPL